MTLWPTAFGRRLPNTDWEGDDFVPGSGGKYVSCMDTAVGRDVFWASNGRINKDGKTYRAAIRPPDPNGITLEQAAQAVHSVTGLTLTMMYMPLAQKLSFLKKGYGLVVSGMYSAVPRAYRFQAFANFTHAMFFSHIDTKGYIRKYDPLNPNTYTFGEALPASVMTAFIDSLPSWDIGYVSLQPL